MRRKKIESPAFQFYPDKFLSGTEHLTPISFMVYVRILCWMWLHSPTRYSMPDTTEAWIIACRIRGKQLEKARKEIMASVFPLFKRNRNTLCSAGLKKEAVKQANWRLKSQQGGKASAKARAHNSLQIQPNGKGGCQMVTTERQPNGNTLSSSLTPFKDLRNVLKGKDGAERTAIQKACERFLINCAELMGEDKRCLISKEQILQDKAVLVSLAIFICKSYPPAEWNDQFDGRAYSALAEQIDNKTLRRPMAAFTSAARRMWPDWKYGNHCRKAKRK